MSKEGKLLAEHEEFNLKMENAKTEEETAKILKDFLSADVVEPIAHGELSEDQLEAVAGGAKWKVVRSGVPVFNRLPGGASQKIVSTYNKGGVITGRIVRDKSLNQWIELPGGRYINAAHVDWVSGSVSSMN